MDEKRLVDGATALAEKQSRVIKIEPAERPQNVRLRVAAYTRVSSDSEDQLNSFAAQNRYYTELISSKAEWRMVDIYADEGITGTSVTKRDDFQRMMADCRRGLIDQILVKSISRFARNTKDCLQNIRELKELGVNIRCSCGARVRTKKINQKWYWCCCNHEESHECQITPIPEIQVQKSFCRLYYKLKHQSISVLEQMLTNLQMIRNRRMLWSPDIVAQNKRISDLSSQNQTLAFLKQQGLVDPDIFIAKTNELTKQLRQAKLEKEKLMDAESDMTALQTRDLIDLLEGGPEFLDSFDAELFGELVEKIIIESNDFVRFCLKNGLELRESIERTVR